MASKLYLFSTQVPAGNTLRRTIKDGCHPQSDLRVGSSRDRQVRASETAVRGLFLAKSSMTGLISSSISKNWCGMLNRSRGEWYYGASDRGHSIKHCYFVTDNPRGPLRDNLLVHRYYEDFEQTEGGWEGRGRIRCEVGV